MQESFESAKLLFEDAATKADKLEEPNCVWALVGNKLDLYQKHSTGSDSSSKVASYEDRQVMYEEAAQYAQEHGMLHMEISAKTGLNVEALYAAIGEGNGKYTVLVN